MFRRILMPTDGSTCSEQAIGRGLELAKALGAEVVFLYALEDPASTLYAAPEVVSYQPQLYRDLKKAAQEALARAQTLAERAGVDATTRLVERRSPVDAIREAEVDVDLVVMGTHGRRGFNRWMFGSVAEGALRRSSKPYLMVRQGEDRGEGERGHDGGDAGHQETSP